MPPWLCTSAPRCAPSRFTTAAASIPFSIAWAKRRVLEAASPLTDPSLLRLREKLERGCGCSIAELAKVAATWPDG